MHESTSESIPSQLTFSERVSRLPRVVSKWTRDLVDEAKAQGTDVLPLYGVPYWAPPAHVLEVAAEAALEPTAANSQGTLAVRTAMSKKLERDQGVRADPNNILVTNAAMHALNLLFVTLLEPGDEVLTFSPSFFYFGAIELAGGRPVYARTKQENGWKWDMQELEQAISPRTKVLLINSPSNPVGYVATRDDLEAIADLAKRHKLLVISDEAYDSMVYDDARHSSFASLSGVEDIAITVYSMTKSYAMGAWRLGFIVAPPALIEQLRKLLEWNVLTCNHVAQRVAQAALEGPQDWVREIATRFQRGRDLMVAGLQDAEGLSFVTPKGAPFIFLNSSSLGVSGDDFFHRLLSRHGVPSDPGSYFGSSDHIRLEFGGENSVVVEAAARIRVAASECLARRT